MIGYRAHFAGTALAGDFIGRFAGVKGDKNLQQDIFQFPRHPGANSICRRCEASKMPGPLLFTNVRPDALWRRRRNPCAMSGPLVGAPGAFVWDDAFHLLWVRGTRNDLAGSVLVWLSQHGTFTGRRQACRDVELEDELQAAFAHFQR